MEQASPISVTDQRKQNIIQTVRDYGKRLFYFIRGRVNTDEDAEDILQDVWYQFSNVMNSEPIEQASGWLYRVAKNRIIDKYQDINRILDDAEDEEANGFYKEILWR